MKFEPGKFLATPGSLNTLERAGVAPATILLRHCKGDWGDLDNEDKCANEAALVVGARILSAYKLLTGEKVWVITEADRSVTTILLPSEY
jgi:hypothetical protein